MSRKTEAGKRVALTLGSGGARGYAHIGVIEVLEARGYEISAISGCSMGSVIAGVFAAGQLEAYRDWVCQLDYFDVLRLVDVTWSPMGAMRASKVMSKLEELIGDIQIEDLPIPLTTVATDLARQREVWFQSGPLLRAIRASIAIPGVITPVHIGDTTLVDGGLLNPLPITPTVSSHADMMMAVNVTAHSARPVTLDDLLPSPSRKRWKRRRSRGGGWTCAAQPAGCSRAGGGRERRTGGERRGGAARHRPAGLGPAGHDPGLLRYHPGVIGQVQDCRLSPRRLDRSAQDGMRRLRVSSCQVADSPGTSPGHGGAGPLRGSSP